MPIYENRTNAENKITVAERHRNAVVVDPDGAVDAILEALAGAAAEKKRGVTAAFDGWYGVDWKVIREKIEAAAAAPAGMTLHWRSANELLFKSPADIAAYKQPFITDDPGFGRVNADGKIEDIMDAEHLRSLTSELADVRKKKGAEAAIVYGSGAAVQALLDSYDLVFYFDKTADPMLWNMWNGELVPFGAAGPKKDYAWKEYYYCDFYLLNRHKNRVLANMDYYLEAIKAEELKIVPREAYDAIIEAAVRYPVKQIKTYSPGPWGAYRYRDLWDIPGLECNAWNRLAGADLSILIEVAQGKVINMPTTNLLRHAESFVGPRVAESWPGLIPLEIWLDDGYFPEPQPPERTSMPVHNHPDTDYVRRHFNEPLGRYETYYIVEAYQGANTWMGFKEDADLELWERKCRESERTGEPIEDWKDFIANWKTNVGDLFLIPPGTTHCHGGNQMVLEMDTCPSVCGAEYSFFSYDFARPTWDDTAKTMTAKPMKMHLDHNFANNKWCREQWVKENLRAKAHVVKWTKEYWIDRFTSYGPMPFEIERIHFTRRGEYSTEGRFIHAATLTVGKRVRIRSLADPELSSEIDFFQTALIPAGFGAYEILNLHEGLCTITLWRLKKG